MPTTPDHFTQKIEHLRRLGADDEFVEVKQAVDKLPKAMWDSVSAFANTEGGEIYLDLAEPNFEPVTGFEPQKVIDAVDDGLSAHPKVDPVPEYDIHTELLDGAPVVTVRISPLPPGAVCHVKAKGLANGSYKRVADKDKKLSSYENYLRRSNATPIGLDRLLGDKGAGHFVLQARGPIRDADREIVSVLSPNDPSTIKDIASRTGRSTTSLRPILRRLVSEGFVTATAAPSSRNRAYLRTT